MQTPKDNFRGYDPVPTKRKISANTVFVGIAVALGAYALVGYLGASNGKKFAQATTTKVVAKPKATERREGWMWVKADRAPRYTCPSETCGMVGSLYFREGVEIKEKRDGYARVTDLYDAACDGKQNSAYVDTGTARCKPYNGIVNGKMAEWISLDVLSDDRPADPADTASVAEKFVAQSDDFRIHRAAFVKAADELIADGSCTGADFTENGGWIKSMKEKTQPVYFTYCGSGFPKAQWYVNAATGRTYRK